MIMLEGQPAGDTMIANWCVPYVLMESHTLNNLQSRLHGLDHWFRVWKNAELLSGLENDADMQIVALYALFHDSMRLNEGVDPGHGMRGFRLFERFIRNQEFLDEFLSATQFELLFEAITQHSDGLRSTDPTIAVCWDADRLDLHRKGIWPDARFMSTQSGLSLVMTRITP